MVIYNVQVENWDNYPRIPCDLTEGHIYGNRNPGEWGVAAYFEDGYDGGGEAIFFKDGKLDLYNLGHCSCYGPVETPVDTFTVEEFLSGDIMKGSSIKEVNDKVRELLNG